MSRIWKTPKSVRRASALLRLMLVAPALLLVVDATPGTAQWSDIESGRKENVTLDTLDKIATALQCDARELITEPDHKVKRVRTAGPRPGRKSK